MLRKRGENTSGVRKARQRWLKRISVVPTLLTLSNMLCGFMAIIIAIEAGEHARTGAYVDVSARFSELMTFSCLLIFGGMVFDTLDGHVARLTHSASLFGREMDSLADVIVFGLAPAVIIWQVDSTLYMTRVDDNLLGLHGRVLWGMLAVYVAGAALRLARYNVETTRAPANTFYGLPSPAAAGTVAALVLLQFQLTAPSQGEWVNWTGYAITRSLPFIAIGLGVLMVSRVYYVHAGKKLLAGSSGLDFILLLMLGVLFFLYQPVLVLAVVFCGYTLWGIAGEIRMRLGAPEEVRKRRDMIAGKLTPEEKQAEDETEHAEKSRSA